MVAHRPGVSRVTTSESGSLAERGGTFAASRAVDRTWRPRQRLRRAGRPRYKSLHRVPHQKARYLLARVIPFPPGPRTHSREGGTDPCEAAPGRAVSPDHPREGWPGCPFDDRPAQGWDDPGWEGPLGKASAATRSGTRTLPEGSAGLAGRAMGPDFRRRRKGRITPSEVPKSRRRTMG